MKDQELSGAIIAYLGKGWSAFPRTEDDAVRQTAVDSDPADLLQSVHAIVAECMVIPVDWSQSTLVEGGREVRRAMSENHHELTESALDALVWMFTYNWR